MNTIIDEMLERYSPKTNQEKNNAVKEIIQEILLCGLSKSGFFHKAVFYGGAALRIFYDLDRYSENLDFSLREPDESFSLKKYFPTLEKEINSMGLNMRIETKKHSIQQSNQRFLRATQLNIFFCFMPIIA